MRNLLYILLFLNCVIQAQTDKLFLKDQRLLKVKVVSVTNEHVYYRNFDTSMQTKRVHKKDILLLERYDGRVQVFGSAAPLKDTLKKPAFYLNSIGAQPFNFLFGRYTVSYERLSKNGKVGLMIPVSLTFDPTGILYRADTTSGQIGGGRTPGYNIIVGGDLNFYLGKNDLEGFYVGPRVRYGVDMFLDNVEAYTIQTQFGFRVHDPEDRVTHHISAGVGFARILSLGAGNNLSSKKSFNWFSINYRIGLAW